MQNYSVSDSWFKSFDGTWLYRQEWKCSDPKAVVIFLHGLGDHSNRHVSTFKRFNDANLDVIAFDQRGHGLTYKGGCLRYAPRQSCNVKPSQGIQGHFEGYKTCYRDMNEILNDTIKSHSKHQKFILMGQSMGGMIALKYMIDHPTNGFCGVISSSPAIQPGFKVPIWKYYGGLFLNLFLKSFTIASMLDLSNLSHDDTVERDYLADPLTHGRISLGTGHMTVIEGKRLMSKPARINVPVLLAHGTADKMTSYDASKRFFENLECANKKFLSYTDGYHELTKDTIHETVMTDYLNWIEVIIST